MTELTHHLSITVSDVDVDELAEAWEQQGAHVDRIESRGLLGGAEVVLLVQATAPIVAAAVSELISWLKTRGDNTTQPANIELDINGKKIRIENASPTISDDAFALYKEQVTNPGS